jgi:RHS repeat-associated protein
MLHVTHINYDINYLNAQGQRVLCTTITDPLGHLTITVVDALNRVVMVSHKNPYGLLTGKQEIVYDLAGNKLFTKETVLTPGAPDRPVHAFWSYNGMNQVLSLTEAWGTHEQKYTQTVYNKYGQKEKIIKADGVIINHSYDDLGHLTQFSANDDSFAYSYDALDRLIRVMQNDQQIHYAYDSFNRRLSKEIYERHGDHWLIKNSYAYILQGQNEIGVVDNGKIVELRLLGTGRGAEIGAAVAIEIKGQVFAPLHDQSGNVVCLINQKTASVVESYRTTAFGEEKIYNSSSELIEPEHAINSWRFSSKRYDPETGFIYFGRRYYQPSTGHWITLDPISYEGGPNLYAYVSNNPLTHIDLYGLMKVITGPIIDEPMQMRFNPMALPGHIIEFIGRELIPFPIISSFFTIIGRALNAQGFSWVIDEPSQNFLYQPPGSTELPGAKLTYTNGIRTSYKDFLLDVDKFSKKHGNAVVYCTYNATHGFAKDILECLAQKLNICTHATDLLVDNLRQRAEEVDGGRVFHYAHSQGGLTSACALTHLTDKQRSVMDVTTFGSACVISNKELAGARNYISRHDLVPLTDPLGYARGLFCQDSNVIFLPSNTLGFDHGINGDTYQGALGDRASYVKDKYGRK